MGHPFADRMRDGLVAWMNEGDGATHLQGLLAPDVVWHLVGPEEPIRGRDAVVAALSGDMQGLTVSGTVHDVLANDSHAVALISVDMTRGDRSVSYRATEIVHHADGLITERWAMVDDFAGMAAFWAD